MPSPVVEDLTQGEPFTDLGPAVVPAKPAPIPPSALFFTPEMKKAMLAKGIPLPAPLPGEQEPAPAADPFAAEKPVAKVDPFAGESQVGKDAFAGERQADALDLRSSEDLATDPKFKIHDFLFQNRDNVFNDPKRYQKALDTYRTAQDKGTTVAKTVESVKTGTVPLLKDLILSIPKRLENLSDVTVAPVANAIAEKFTGGSLNKENHAAWEDMTENDRQKALAEAVAGSQTAVGSLQDMMRQGARKLVGPAFSGGGKKSWKDLTDDEVKTELFKDLGWRETVEGLSRGEGAKDLVDKGVALDPENIKLLSLTDPITLVATAGGLKAVSTGGRVLFTAANESGATAAMDWLGQKAGQAAAKGVELAGKGAEATGKGIKEALPVSGHGAVTAGMLHMLGVPGKVIAGVRLAAPVIQKGGALVREIGEAAGGAPGSEGAQLTLGLSDTAGAKIVNAAKTAAAVAKPPVVGALKGAAAASPLAFATDEPQGGLLGVGALVGAAHGAVSGIHGAVSEAGAKRYFDPGQITWEKTESPGYDNFSTLNQAHQFATADAPENTRNMVNSLRETLRPFDRKLFLVDDATYRTALENDAKRENGGQPLTAEQTAALDKEAQTRGISKIYVADDAGKGEMVTLVRSSEAAPHEFSHVLESVMSPEARKSLHESVVKNYSEAERENLKNFYEKQTGRSMTDDDVESEFLADNWANLLYNTPLESLGLPEPKPGLRESLLRTTLSLGEQLGVNMSAGRVTPGLGVRPSFNLRTALVDATGELLSERNSRTAQGPAAKATPAPQPEAPIAPMAPAAPVDLGPVVAKTEPNTPVAQPTAVLPAAPSVRPPQAKNIRVTPQQHADLAAAKAATTNTELPENWAAKQSPESSATIATINQALDQGHAVTVIHSGAEAGEHAAGETARAAEVEAGRGRTEGELHSKDFFPTRWETVKSTGEPILIARSVDKVLANVERALPMMKAAGESVPWASDAEGNLTAEGRTALLSDLKTYWLNQDAGHRGGGGIFVRPSEVGKELGESLPARQGEGVPLDSDAATSDAKEQFLNMVQGKDLGPPETVREVKGQKPKNILAQELQVLQKVPGRTPEPVAGLPVREFKSGGQIQEVNPLRNRLRAAKQPVNELETITERLKASDITSAEARPELTGRGGATDITRGGFLTDQPNEGEGAKYIHMTDPGFLGMGEDVYGPINPDKIDVAITAFKRSAANRGRYHAKFKILDSVPEGARNVFSPVDYFDRSPSMHEEAASWLPKAESRGGFLTDQPVDKTVEDVFKTTPEEWQKFFGPEGSLTKSAFKLGLGLKSADELAALRAAQERASAASAAAMTKVRGGDFDALDEASSSATKAQFFREAVETATDTASAAGPAGWRRYFPEGKPAFAESKGAFLPESSDPDITALAEDYAKKAGIEYTPAKAYGALKPELSKRLADFYEEAKSAPDAPEVKASYSALSKEVLDQYKAITDAGYSIEPYEGKGEPYKNSAEAVKDIRDNKHLYFLQMDKAFGTEPTSSSNPMLADSGVEINGHKLPVNDVFRAVHDFFGHGKEGYQFGPRGEFNAWRAHAEMFSPEAQGALAAETLAQNSWVNFGKHLRNEAGDVPAKGEPGHVPMTERPFGEQKNVVVPADLINEARAAASTDRGAFLPRKMDLPEAEELSQKKGWLSPEGKFYALKPGDTHEEFADAALRGKTGPYAASTLLQDGKWVRVTPTGGSDMVAENLSAHQLTNAQRRALKDFAASDPELRELSFDNGSDRPEILHRSDDAGAYLPDRPLDLEVKKRVEEKRVAGIPVTEAIKRKARQEVEFEVRNKSLSPDEKAGFFLPKKKQPRETEAEANARVEATDYSKYNVPEDQKPAAGASTGWALPDGTFVPLDTAYHQEWIAQNSQKLNKDFGTDFSTKSDVEDRLKALNAGFVRFRTYGGTTHVELNEKFFRGKTRAAVESQVLDSAGDMDKLQVSLLNDQGQVVDSASAKLFDSDSPRDDAQAALDSLKPGTGSSKGPSAIQRARYYR